MQLKKLSLWLLFALLLASIIWLFPYLFKLAVIWQREFNQQLSQQLHLIKQDSVSAGLSLVFVSFIYGVLHALGPGHGKFIITSYLSTHQSKISSSMKLSFFSSLTQGLVAIAATSIVVVLLNLSSTQFKTSQLWLERAAYALIFLLGLQWVIQSVRQLMQRKARLKIKAIQLLSNLKVGENAVQKSALSSTCSCGHQHLPDQAQLEVEDIKSRLLVILSIGIRPCTGAIFILFLAYMLDLYAWGMLATMAMALGTAITLSSFALLVLYARNTAIKLGKWYLAPQLRLYMPNFLKLIFALLLIGFAISLIYATTLNSSGGAVLLGR